MRTVTTLGLLTTAVLALGATAGSAVAAPAHHGDRHRTEVVYVDPSGARLKGPDSIALSSADGNDVLTQLMWSRWDARKAVATGSETVNDCTPSCAEGTPQTRPVTVELRHARPFADRGEKYFTQAVVHSAAGSRTVALR